MDGINCTEEGTGGHEMWPIDDDGIIIGEGGASGGICDDSDVGRHTLTLYVKVGNGIVARSFNADTVFTEDMFRSQDPDLCATGPNDPLAYVRDPRPRLA